MMKSICLNLFPSFIFATFIGNPALPSLEQKGIFKEAVKSINYRTGYFGDYVYRQRFKEDFVIGDCEAISSHLQTWMQAATFTINLINKIDLYGILGGMRIKVDEEVKTSQQFAWGVGGKITFLNYKRFKAGCDIKYIQSNQSPNFFECEHLAYNIVRDFHYNYHEFQVAAGLAYKTSRFSPYINGSYLISKLQPNPAIVSVRFPMMDEEVDVTSKSITTHNRFGLAIGCTIIDQEKATLTLEWRAINQNSINVSGEIRF